MAFKTCTCCQKAWDSRVEFILSPEISLHSYQPAFDKPEKGLLLFNHIAAKCGTTLAVPVDEFADMYRGPHYLNLKRDTIKCSGKCLNPKDLGKCDAKCSMAYVREIMQIILHLNSNINNISQIAEKTRLPIDHKRQPKII
jgi:hypothetical protein